jgi:NADH-quinone oxidoreductase subunit I
VSTLGKGLLDGFAVTAKNFVQSYFDGDKKEKLFTYQYPEEKMPLPENSRAFPFLVYDGAPDKLRCTACKICEIECPPQCIYIVMERDEKGKPLQRPQVFDIDLSVCMQCGICVEVCPFESIKMDCDYEKSQYGRFAPLLAHLPDLRRPNEYYHQIKPTEAAAVDAALKAAAEKKAKKPVPPPKPVAPPPPVDVLTAAERQAWVAGYQAPLGTGPITWPPPAVAAIAPKPVKAETPATISPPSPGGGEPWHDTGLTLEQRLDLAKDRSLADKLMAAMAQTDCSACGYDCRGYADALAAQTTDDVTLCVPGEEATRQQLEHLLKEAGKR